MCGRTRVRAAAIVVLAATSSAVQAAEPASTETLIRQIIHTARQNRLSRPPLAMDVEITKLMADNRERQQERPIERQIWQYRQRGSQVDSALTRYLPNPQGEFYADGYTVRSLWDGQRAWHRQGVLSYATHGWVSQKDDLAQRVLFSSDGSNVLDGLLPHNLYAGDWTEVLEKEPSRASLRLEKELVVDRPCWVLEADTPHGTYTLWVDEDNGGCLRQANIRVDADDWAWGKPLRQSYERKGDGLLRYYRRLEIALSNVVIERIGETFVPVAGTFLSRIWGDDGYQRTVTRVIKRANIAFNPDFEAMGAFQIDMPDGTIVRDQDLPGVKYQWTGGRLVPYVGENIGGVANAKGTGTRDPRTCVCSTDANDGRTSAASGPPRSGSVTEVSHPLQRPALVRGWSVPVLLAASVALGYLVSCGRRKWHKPQHDTRQ